MTHFDKHLWYTLLRLERLCDLSESEPARVSTGDTVIVIKHNLDMIKTADWIIDLGPEGGDAGGYVVVEGTPEEVTQIEESYTGKFLQQML